MGITKEYKDYLKSDIWKGKRELVLDTLGKKCKKCCTHKNLQVHHKTYDRIFHECIEDFEVLCFKCHVIYHGSESDIRKKRAAINTYMTKKYNPGWQKYITYDVAWDEFDDWLEEKEGS